MKCVYCREEIGTADNTKVCWYCKKQQKKMGAENYLAQLRKMDENRTKGDK